ncbi:O-methyltransferase [Dioszegia hungarica]|uniref:O-methyltransferase n=1 Tax=Dioszegia hungarica TaxID=4972 RepID=A0AA38HAX2_9TREE|nr:O-methyltransferase [Dioszegia hungarica]KAI9636034.1 O-methyltransferase [Dioszegia hungarica]
MSFYPQPAQQSEKRIIHQCPVRAPAGLLGYLDSLHTISTEQEDAIDRTEVEKVGFDNYMKDKYIALDQDKCWFVYQTCLATGARNVVEAGTSFGVSTIYLSLAVQQTIKLRGGEGRVIATENEPEKAARARSTWAEAGEGVADLIDLREGDLRETLKDGLADIDLLLLDIWAPLALPALRLVEPHFRRGAVVICDNSISSADRYADLQAYMRDPKNGYANLTVPFKNGLEMSVYLGRYGGT